MLSGCQLSRWCYAFSNSDRVPITGRVYKYQGPGHWGSRAGPVIPLWFWEKGWNHWVKFREYRRRSRLGGRDEGNKLAMRTIGWRQGQQARDEDSRPAMSTTGPVMRDIKIIFRRNLQIFSKLWQKVHFPRFCSWQRLFYFVSLQKFHITFSGARLYESILSIALLAKGCTKTNRCLT